MRDMAGLIGRSVQPKKVQDSILGLYGDFGVRFFDEKTQETVFKCEKRNQITNEGRDAILELLFQDPAGTASQQDPGYNQLWSLSVGTGILPPTVADTGLVSPVFSSAFNFAGGELTKVTLPPTTYELVINKTIPSGTLADGTEVAEAGIFTRGNADDPGAGNWEDISYRRMYARQVHPAIVITATLAITYEWRLGVTIQGS